MSTDQRSLEGYKFKQRDNKEQHQHGVNVMTKLKEANEKLEENRILTGTEILKSLNFTGRGLKSTIPGTKNHKFGEKEWTNVIGMGYTGEVKAFIH